MNNNAPFDMDSLNKEFAELENLKDTSSFLSVLSKLRYLYVKECQLSVEGLTLIEEFCYGGGDPSLPEVSILFSESVEVDRDNDVMINVRRYVKISYSPRNIFLLKTADVIGPRHLEKKNRPLKRKYRG